MWLAAAAAAAAFLALPWSSSGSQRQVPVCCAKLLWGLVSRSVCYSIAACSCLSRSEDNEPKRRCMFKACHQV